MSDEIKKAVKGIEEISKKDHEREAIYKLNEMGCLTISLKDYIMDLRGKFKKSDEEIKKMMEIIEDFKDTEILKKNGEVLMKFLHELKKYHPVESIRVKAELILESLTI